jgi:hypothetical protein
MIAQLHDISCDKDREQGNALLEAVREFMSVSYPLDIDFVLDLPEELLRTTTRGQQG